MGAALAVSVLLPPLAAGDPVGDLLGGVGVGGGSGGGVTDVVTGAASNRAGTPPNYKPPLHGTNPHGQGTVATVDINPSDTNPYPANPQDGGEEIVIGQSRGEQNGSTYHGRVTLAYVNLSSLVPLSPVHVFIETGPGQTNTGPTGPLNTAIQDAICDPSGDAVCLSVLSMNSSTSSTGSSNSFSVLDADANIPALEVGASANAGSSSGNIQESGGCQTATGTSSVADGNVGPVTYEVLSGSSTSTACNNGQQSTQNNSTVLNIAGFAPPFPVPGCANGTPNSVFIDPILGLVSTVCHADEVNAGQTSAPYGVREALAAFVTVPEVATVRLAAAGSESHAVAPPAAPQQPTPTPTPAPGPGRRNPGDDRGPQREAGAGGPAAAEAAEGDGRALPFTGQNLLLLGLIGAGLISLGLLGIAARERRTV